MHTNRPMFPYKRTITAAILETSLDAAFTIRQDGLIVDVNTAATRMFGWSRQELLGRNISVIVAAPHKSSHDGYLRNFDPHRGVSHILGNGRLLKAEHKDGSQFPVEVGISSFILEGQQFFTGFVRDMTERQSHVDELHRLATHDDDTGLLNFRGFRALAEGHPETAGQSCLQLQLQGFSRAIASQGRPAGKQILIAVTERLRQCAATHSHAVPLARVGEAAFALLVSGDALGLAEKIQAAVNTPIPYEGMALEVVTRIGVSQSAGTFEARFREAMAACEQVNRVCGGVLPFSMALAERLRRELLIESRLRHAVTENALRLVLQPKLDLRSEQVVGAEALVRWQDAELGMVSPADFIPIAERTGQIRPITDWVLAQSLAAIRPYAGRGFSVAVNFSALDFQQPDVVQRVQAALADAQVAPRQLVIELTESAVADDPAATAARMHDLKALGIAISLDDFGTGYSSLSYLSQFPIDTLKIDASFVRDTPDNANANAIAAAVAALAGALNMSTVAEGVETRAQADFLKTLHVDQCQGYLFSRPLTPGDFDDFVIAPSHHFVKEYQ